MTLLDFDVVFGAVQRRAHEVNVTNGWWEKREQIDAILRQHGIDNSPHQVIELLGLVDSENAEAMEAARKHPRETWGDAATKDTLVREMAGSVVRLMDLAERYNLPLAAAIRAEIAHNETRGHRHGGKAA